MTSNMGTPASPEGVPHWSIKTLLWHKLKRALCAPMRTYGTPLPSDFRNVTIPEKWKDDTLFTSTIQHATERIDPMPRFAYLACQETPHNQCEGGFQLVNILEGMDGGRVELEKPFAGFIPDISLYAKGKRSPHIVIEVVHTSRPSKAKLASMKRHNVEVYQVITSDKNPLVILEEPVLATRLVSRRCGKALRDNVFDMFRVWGETPNPFIGIRDHDSGMQEYLFGEHDRWADVTWQHGDPMVRGLIKMDVEWKSPPLIMPVASKTKTISRTHFMHYLMWQKCVITQLAHAREDKRPDSIPGYVRFTRLEHIVTTHINDLLAMVRSPMGHIDARRNSA